MEVNGSLADIVLYRSPQLHNMACYKDVVEMLNKLCFDLDVVSICVSFRLVCMK